jgi:hypothetical protein
MDEPNFSWDVFLTEETRVMIDFKVTGDCHKAGHSGAIYPHKSAVSGTC